MGVSLVVRGEGVPVFLMHGIGGRASSCAALAIQLSAHGYRTYCWDAPGYGLSADPSGDVDHADVVQSILRELDTGPVLLFGTSWGGVIAAQVAYRIPEGVLAVVLADSTRGSSRTTKSKEAMLQRLADLAELGAEQFAAQRAARLVSPAAAGGVRDAVYEDMASVRASGYSAAARMMARTDNTDILSRLRVPALVVVGEHDVVAGVPESKLLSEIIPDATFKIIPDAGHAAVQEKPEDMAELMLAYWADRSFAH